MPVAKRKLGDWQAEGADRAVVSLMPAAKRKLGDWQAEGADRAVVAVNDFRKEVV